MTTNRVEAFSDGVLAIILTIMVLELKTPEGARRFADLEPMYPTLLSYVLSFVFVGIYWNNHHHLLTAADEIDGRVLWANLHLLFWLSLTPFVTAWMGTTRFQTEPVALYGVVMLMAGVAYFILARTLVARQGSKSPLGKAIGRDRKGKVSIGLYAAAIPLAFVSRWIALAIYIAVAAMWLVPDRRIEDVLVD